MKVSAVLLLFLACSMNENTEAKKLGKGHSLGDVEMNDLYSYTEQDDVKREIEAAKTMMEEKKRKE